MLRVNNLVGFGKHQTERVPFSITFTDRDLNTSNATSRTFTGMALGTPAAGRIIVVLAGASLSGSCTMTGCVINGVTATIAGTQSGSNRGIGVAWAIVPDDAIGDITTTFSASARQYIGVYSITGVTAPHDVHVPGGGGNATRTATLDIPAGGAVVAMVTKKSSSGASFSSGVDSTDYSGGGSNDSHAFGIKETASALADHDITGSSVTNIAAISFG